MAEQKIQLWRHQAQFLESPWRFEDIFYHFLIGGYGCGKSFSIVMLIVKIAKLYYTQPCTGILSSSTISLLKKTVIQDLIKVLEASKIPYRYNQADNIVQIGAVKFYLIGSDDPGRVYGYSVSFAICDELDELPIDKCQEFVKAITERVRVPFPRGKKPFVCMPTTAQGLKGIFATIHGFRENGIPYVMIKGRTKDNLANDPTYVRNLYRQYTELEQKAFLEGEFVNLNEGRVYGEYDDTVHDVDRIDIGDDEVIYVGQDLNSGFSKAVALVKRDCDLYIVKDFSFKSVGDIPRVLRQHFPSQRIVWVPDASSKEIMAGYAKEVRQYKIEIKIAYVNPSITERIFIVNKLFRQGRMYLVKKDAKDLSLALKVRQFDETGKPSKGRGTKAPDHLCDALDIVCYRIVGFDADFKDIWELAKPMRGNKTGEASLRVRPEDEVFTSTEG